MPSALLIGNGPSAAFLQHPAIYQSFFKKMADNKIDTFSMNKFIRIFDEQPELPSPDYYVCADALVLVDIAPEIHNYVDRFKKLFLSFPHGYDEKEGMLHKLVNLSTPYPEREKYAAYEKISDDLKNHPSVISTRHRVTGQQAILIAVSLGYTDIYLIGLDETYAASLDEDDAGGFVMVGEDKSTSQINSENYAFKNYIRPGDTYSLGNSNRIPAFETIGSELITDPGLKIQNLSDISLIRIFPKLPLTEFMENLEK